MAPEVVSETPYTESVDVWSMAITMIEMMDRVPPLYYLDGNREIFAEILYGQQPHFNFAMPSRVMVELISWMLDPDADKRPGAKSALMVNMLISTLFTCTHAPSIIASQTTYYGWASAMC